RELVWIVADFEIETVDYRGGHFGVGTEAQPRIDHKPQARTYFQFISSAGCSDSRTNHPSREFVSLPHGKSVLRVADEFCACKDAVASTKIGEMQLVTNVGLAAALKRRRQQRDCDIHRHIERLLGLRRLGGLRFGFGLIGLSCRIAPMERRSKKQQGSGRATD